VADPGIQMEYNSVVGNSTLSELIPIGDLSMDQRDTVRKSVDIALVKTAISKAVSNNPAGLVVRDLLPFTDLGLTGNTSAESWLITNAATAGTLLNYINAKQLSTTQCAGFWGVAGGVAPSNVSAVKFFFGAANAQIKAFVQIQQLLSRLEPEGLFSTPIIYVAQDTLSVQVMPTTSFAANTEQLILLSRMCDQFGQTISAHNYAA
jgi:hypothetical protein